MAKQFSRSSPRTGGSSRSSTFSSSPRPRPADGVNLSPKGLDGLRVLGPREVVYLDRTGSGSEDRRPSAGRRPADPDGLRLRGGADDPQASRPRPRGPRGGDEYARLLAGPFGGREPPPGVRLIVRLDVDLVQTSCGFGVPLFDYVGERTALTTWAEHQGEEGLRAYRAEKN